MNQINSNTEHKKGKHLTYEDYVLIEIRLKDGWKANRIAKEIGCAPNTVRNIIEKGTVLLYRGKVKRFKADVAWNRYQSNLKNSGRRYDYLEKRRFIDYVREHFYGDHWSLDACVGYALANGDFQRDEMVCTKTLYNYTDIGLIGIKNIDLPMKLRRKAKHKRVRENKRVLGTSIEERPESIENRDEFGHWEIDLVIGNKKKEDDVLLTLIERQTRNAAIVRLPDKTPESVMNAFKGIQNELGDKFSQVFKTITTDNGTEFSRLAELEGSTDTKVYFTHPYTSCEKGSIEHFNGMIRRFIPKGKNISDFSDDDILEVILWANNLPRKILNYLTAEEAFEAEMDRVYAA